jgi:putative hemolysin
MGIFFVSVAAALGISAICSLLEAVVLSLTPGQVDDLVRTHPRAGAIWQGFKAQIQRPIAVILVLNTAAHTVGATIAGAKFEEQFGDAGLVWFSILFTYLMLQFTEILPKTMGVKYNRPLAPLVAGPLVFFVKILAPLLWIIHFVNKPFERKSTGHDVSTLEEIAALAGLARLGGLLGVHQERIIRGASRLSRMTAKQLMIDLKEISFLSTSQTLHDALMAAHEDPHTRFPICEDNDKNKVAGYVNFKEMIYWSRTNPADPGLLGIIRPVHFALPDTPAPELLKAFVDRHEHIAIIQTATGETLGLVTLEDLVEELVGELEDEFDRLPRMLHHMTGGTWMVGGGVPMPSLAEKLNINLGDASGNLSKWIIDRFGRMPRVGEVHREAGLEFMIRRIRRGKVFEVAITMHGKRV